jgi:5-formyltetrahydrofolate cyclo-ligase
MTPANTSSQQQGIHMARRHLRQQMRTQRRSLSALQQYKAAIRLACHLSHHPRLRQARRVALYVGQDNELDPWRFVQRWRQQKQLYLPALHPDGSSRLCFIDAGTRKGIHWKRNRFGIREPVFRTGKVCPLWQLDVLLVPLVAFSRDGGRLGRGGGFYDRTLATLPTWGKRPWCIGIGYHFQECDNLPLQEWDQPLDDFLVA